MRTRSAVLGAAVILLGTACADSPASPGRLSPLALRGVFATTPAGYGDLTSSFVGVRADMMSGDSAWVGGGRERHMPPGEMMGGGMDGAFLGGIGFGGRHGHEGPFGGGLACSGTFDAATGRVACDPVALRNGLTITRSAAYADASGAAQPAFDTLTTNTVNIRTTVAGTLTFVPHDGGPGGMDGGHMGPRGDMGPGPMGGGGHHGGPGHGPGGMLLGDTAHILAATTTVSSASDRTVSGLAQGSTQRTVSGVSSGTESTTGTSTRGEFSATRSVADTTAGLVIPVSTDGRSYPTAGRVARTMTATLAYAGQSPITVSRREVVTYDGSATATVVITEDGLTRTCTRALPRGMLVCT